MSETKEKIFLIDKNAEYAEEVNTITEAGARLNKWAKDEPEEIALAIFEGKIFIVKAIPILPTPIKFQFKLEE